MEVSEAGSGSGEGCGSSGCGLGPPGSMLTGPRRAARSAASSRVDPPSAVDVPAAPKRRSYVTADGQIDWEFVAEQHASCGGDQMVRCIPGYDGSISLSALLRKRPRPDA
jgi:hypothetical protein